VGLHDSRFALPRSEKLATTLPAFLVPEATEWSTLINARGNLRGGRSLQTASVSHPELFMKTTLFLTAAALVLAGGAIFADDAKEDLQALHNAKLSLTDAIRMAEKEGGGQAIEAELESDNGHARYDVEVLSSDGKKLTEYKLDANTGKIEKASNEPLEKLVERVKPEDLQKVQTSLSAAIHSAEQQTGGKVVDAETEGSGNDIRYELEIAMADGTTSKLKVDASTGKVASK
jgi:uncharacterized membrane protein YkoI